MRFKKFIKFVAGFLAVLLAPLLVLTLMAWVNNIVDALQWRPNQPMEFQYVGWFKWLDWTAVDVSTATTFIPFYTLCFLEVGLWRVVRRHKGQAKIYFPFHQRFIQFVILLGLIGTVLGFIMYGYYTQRGRSLDQRFSDLMICMRTALFSTQMAFVALAFLIWETNCIWRWAYNRTSEDAGSRKTGLGETLAALKGSAQELDGALASAASKATALDQSIQSATTAVSGLTAMLKGLTVELPKQVSGAIQTVQTAFTAIAGNFAAEAKARQATAEKQGQVLDTLLATVKAVHEEFAGTARTLREEAAKDRREAAATLKLMLEAFALKLETLGTTFSGGLTLNANKISGAATEFRQWAEGLAKALMADRETLEKALAEIQTNMRERIDRSDKAVQESAERLTKAHLALLANSDGGGVR